MAINLKFCAKILVLVAAFETVNSIRCWECHNAKGEEECLKLGKLRNCESSEEACQVEVRHHEGWGFGAMITKRCKQAHACENNLAQNNAHAWFPTQCNPKFPTNSVCRCCCYTDECNYNGLECNIEANEPDMRSEPMAKQPIAMALPKPRDCPEIVQLVNSEIKCTNEFKESSQCAFKCKVGFRIEGKQVLTCRLGKWNNDLPVCLPNPTCNPVPTTPENGILQCSNNYNIGSVCQFQCTNGFEIFGNEKITCLKNGKWDKAPPICKDRNCPLASKALINGKVQCSKESKVGSICTFQCDSNFSLNGTTSMICKEDGTWDNKIPTCIRQVCIPQIAPPNGKFNCSNESSFGSECKFYCETGFKLVGYQKTTCTDQETWDNETPFCLRKSCRPQTAPSNGRIICKDESNVGSQCQFECEPGFALVGPLTINCTDEETWDQDPPICKSVNCTPKPRSPKEGIINCNDGNNIGSKCIFDCKVGFQLVGQADSVCMENGSWSNESPLCIKRSCTDPDAPTNGFISCLDNLNGKRECFFECNSSYKLVGAKNLICADAGNWNNQPPMCKTVCDPPQIAPFNGTVDCSNKNFNGSRCTFTCDDTHYISDVDVTTCQENGEWTEKPPLCLPKFCVPAHESPENGDIKCSPNTNVGSSCVFSCKMGYALIGSSKSTCNVKGADGDFLAIWSEPAPTCKRVMCYPKRFDFEYGKVNCTDENSVNSKCKFECNPGFKLDGNPHSICQDDGNGDELGVWSDIPPRCRPIQCLPEQKSPENGYVNCSQHNLLGTNCEFSCFNDYQIVGSKEITCNHREGLNDIGLWSDSSPTCGKKACTNEIAKPEKGRVSCSDNNYINSVCSFTCKESYELIGDATSVCVELNEEMQWSGTVPMCIYIPSCENQILPHGKVTCSNSNKIDSICEFQCMEENYQIYPSGADWNVCTNDTEWNRPKPCCARTCPPFAVMDLILILDSSSSMGGYNFGKVKQFVQMFVSRFEISEDAAKFGVFRFNKEIDTETQILLSQNIDVSQVTYDIDNIPYHGSGTHTGKAINHTVNVMLSKENGNREKVKDIVVIITDGKSQDDISEPARRLHETGALVYALPISPPKGKLDMKQIEEITGDGGRVIKTAFEEGFEALTNEFSYKLGEKICGNPCDHVTHDHD